jgi:undecaprenyl-diphosphatase
VATEGTGERPAASSVAGADWLADRLQAADSPQWQRLEAGLRQLGAVDRAVYRAIASVPTPALDEPIRRLSRAADNSRLWLAIAAALAITGGSAGRRAAVRGVLSIGVTSAVVNLGIKSVYTRRRPDRQDAGLDVVPVGALGVGVRLRLRGGP